MAKQRCDAFFVVLNQTHKHKCMPNSQKLLITFFSIVLILEVFRWNEQKKFATNVIGAHLLYVLISGKIAINFFDVFSARIFFWFIFWFALIYLFLWCAYEKIGQIYCGYAGRWLWRETLSKYKEHFFPICGFKKSPLFRPLYILYLPQSAIASISVATMVLNLDSCGREINRCYHILSNWIFQNESATLNLSFFVGSQLKISWESPTEKMLMRYTE